jgi:hypothetical protein
MAKKKSASKKLSGPYLSAAFFCDQIVEEKDSGVLSCIRIIDTINLTVAADAPKDVPSETHQIPVTLNGLVAFKRGDAKVGSHDVKLVGHSPSGKVTTLVEKVVPFREEKHGGMNLRLNATIAISIGGLFWVHVYLDGKEYTRIPLNIVVHRESASKKKPKR